MSVQDSLPAVPIDVSWKAPEGAKAGSWRVLHTDGTVLFESPEENAARARVLALSSAARIRLAAGRPVSGSDLFAIFPPSAPAPLILGCLSSDELQREDVFDSSSGTWSMRNVEVFRSGKALKRVDGKWVVLDFVDDDTRDLVDSFAALGWTPPVKVTHGSDQAIVLADLPSIARTTALRAAEVKDPQGVKRLGAFADFEKVPVALRDAIKDGRLHGRSIEFWRNKIPRVDGKEGTYPLVLKAVALLGAELPAVRGMAPIDVAPEKFSAGAESETIQLQEESMDPANKAGKVELSQEEYQKLLTDLANANGKVTTLSTQTEDYAKRLVRLETERKVESAAGAATRLRAAGKITPAQEQNVVELLKALDGDKDDAVTVLGVGEDKKPTETKKSQRAALLSLLDSFPKLANAPGAAATKGDRDITGQGGDASEFASLSVQEQDSAIAAHWNKLCADAKVDPSKPEGRKLYSRAVKEMRDGTAEIVR